MTTTTYINRFLEPVAEAFTPELARTIVNIKADPELQARVDELADKANEGRLTAEEAADYKSLIEAADILGIIQAKARRYLARH